MPKIAVYRFLTFFIFAYDALHEPPHLHVVKERGRRQRSAKIWLDSFKVAEKGTLNERELPQALRIMKEHQQEFIAAFNAVKNGKKIKTIKLK